MAESLAHVGSLSFALPQKLADVNSGFVLASHGRDDAAVLRGQARRRGHGRR
jgi:hypothetical protein